VSVVLSEDFAYYTPFSKLISSGLAFGFAGLFAGLIIVVCFPEGFVEPLPDLAIHSSFVVQVC